MATDEPVSRLESLPAELFNRVLGYVLYPDRSAIPDSSTQFRTYRFDTAILRVNKAIHQLGKSYLHNSLSWIRFDINWSAFLIDPHWLGVSYITINRRDIPQSLPYSYNGNSKRRWIDQDAPAGRLHVRVAFPPATTPGQKEIEERTSNSHFTSSMSLLVLSTEFKRFLNALRMNDLAFCNRTSFGETAAEGMPADPGISFDIRVTVGQELAKFKHLIHEFRVFHGPPHQCNILTASIVTNMDSVLRLRNSEVARLQTFWEGVSHLFYLKWKGDEYLRTKQYSNAYMCYDAALSLEKYWLAHDSNSSKERFWKPTEDIAKVFGLSVACNIAIAEVAGGLRMGKKRIRGNSMLQHLRTLLHTTRSMALNTMLAVISTAALFEVFTEGHDLMATRQMLEMFTTAWELHHGTNCAHRASTGLGKIYSSAKLVLDALNDCPNHPNDIGKRVEPLRPVAKGVNFEPMKWAVHESLIPERLKLRTKPFLTTVQIRKNGHYIIPSDILVVIPGFNQPSEEATRNGEEGKRFLI
ncbi:hypothetical protein P153DRAFT_324878 [Dothidotthia symphoricarpi CBS 119687]|uniref:Uncharacterized protein n=1 Tax=Dothidotthia symphoricarpi CBS 119687 TaxID=1392245 RepID=A0A6A6A4H9_9PLEO|nr:uncharacterized protein P153DRAFT_324878 [Dothidotthia symphoricarpi CBS 119687]KAF2125501.1 hypothetical protein P153DRAFT_324878 [Dothidotthia symphoricarpi CBS 119687]